MKKLIFYLIFQLLFASLNSQSIYNKSNAENLNITAQGFAFLGLSDGVCVFVFSNQTFLENVMNEDKLPYILFDGNNFIDFFNVTEYVDTNNVIDSKVKLVSHSACNNGRTIKYYRCNINFQIPLSDFFKQEKNYIDLRLSNENKCIKLLPLLKVKNNIYNVNSFKIQ